MLPFELCDPHQRKLAHPIQLSSLLMLFPAVAKLINGSNLVKLLSQMKVVIPLVVNANTGSVQNLHLPNATTPQSVGYELPIAMEEYLSYYLLECQSLAMEHQFRLLKIQVLTLERSVWPTSAQPIGIVGRDFNEGIA